MGIRARIGQCQPLIRLRGSLLYRFVPKDPAAGMVVFTPLRLQGQIRRGIRVKLKLRSGEIVVGPRGGIEPDGIDFEAGSKTGSLRPGSLKSVQEVEGRPDQARDQVAFEATPPTSTSGTSLHALGRHHRPTPYPGSYSLQLHSVQGKGRQGEVLPLGRC
jgi:hypothetical protein